MKLSVTSSDLQKVHDTLRKACEHHVARDESNAALHLAAYTRYSPLTSELVASRDRIHAILNESPEVAA